ncbi:MAG: hypothetical protein PHF86_00895 [Candidatus Nanoarchaeia archaeon]|nr:hypothetical protein [Candidatus Nanoarchaeia archaeon]
MKLVKEFIDFERGLSDKEIRSKLFGFIQGQILASNKIYNESIYKIDEEGVYKLWIYVGKSESPYYLNAKYNIIAYPLGYISESGKLAYMNKIVDASNLMTNDSKLRILTDKETNIVKSYLDDPKNKEYIKGVENYLNLKIFL